MRASCGRPLRKGTANDELAPHLDLDLHTGSHRHSQIQRQEQGDNSPLFRGNPSSPGGSSCETRGVDFPNGDFGPRSAKFPSRVVGPLADDFALGGIAHLVARGLGTDYDDSGQYRALRRVSANLGHRGPNDCLCVPQNVRSSPPLCCESSTGAGLSAGATNTPLCSAARDLNIAEGMTPNARIVWRAS